MREIQKRFQTWRKKRTAGIILWNIARPLIGLVFLSIHLIMHSGAILRWVFGICWLVLALPDLIPLIVNLTRFIRKKLGFGKFKAGDLLTIAQKDGQLLYSVMYSAEFVNLEDCLNYRRHKLGCPVSNDIKTTKLLDMRHVIKNSEPGQGYLVVEDEELVAYPDLYDDALINDWNPFARKNTARVKIFADTGVYWANPRFFVKLTKDDGVDN